MKKYFGKFASSGDVQTAVDSGALSNPYVASISGYGLDYNSIKYIDYSTIPLTLEILTGGTIYFKSVQKWGSETATIQYRINGGNWVSITSAKDPNAPSFTVQAGDIVEMVGNQGKLGTSNQDYNYLADDGVVRYNVYGNAMSLIDSTNYASLSALTASGAFAGLFKDSGVVSAEHLQLPTVLRSFAFCMMFDGAQYLTTAPVMTASVLMERSNYQMFNNCSSLQYIKCLATDLSANLCLASWVYNVSATGTFVKKAGVNWPTGADGIPRSWTVIEE